MRKGPRIAAWAIGIAALAVVLAFIAAAVVLILPFTGWSDVEAGWRQRMTVVVETPQGGKAGASVIAIDVAVGTGSLAKKQGGSPVSWHIRGEAVDIDVGGGRHLFALLTGPGWFAQPGRNAMPLFTDWENYQPGRDVFPVEQIADAPRDTPRALPRRSWPLMVTFDDIADPKTVRRVDPDDMDAVLGCDRDTGDKPWRALGMTWRSWARWQASGLSLEDYRRKVVSGYPAPALVAKMDRDAPAARDTAADCHRLASVTLEITDEPVTEGKVEEVLGWMDSIGGGMLDGERFSSINADNRLANDLTLWDFRRP